MSLVSLAFGSGHTLCNGRHSTVRLPAQSNRRNPHGLAWPPCSVEVPRPRVLLVLCLGGREPQSAVSPRPERSLVSDGGGCHPRPGQLAEGAPRDVLRPLLGVEENEAVAPWRRCVARSAHRFFRCQRSATHSSHGPFGAGSSTQRREGPPAQPRGALGLEAPRAVRLGYGLTPRCAFGAGAWSSPWC
jgi:hypothetical protein